MARKAREILKARGYTEEQLTALTILNDATFCSAIEAEDAEQERLRGIISDNTRWYENEAVPALNRALADATTARGEAARLKAQLDAETEYGMRRLANQDGNGGVGGGQGGNGGGQGGNGNGNGGGGNGGGASEVDPRYVTTEAFTQTADRFGEAIATATDISEDHRDLFGSRLPGGVGQLRKEYQDAIKNRQFQGDLRAYWEHKFNVAGKRTEIANREREEHDRKVAADAIQKYQSENLNPMTRTPIASNNPFMRKQVAPSQGVNGQQPWDSGPTVEQRRAARVTKFGQKMANAS